MPAKLADPSDIVGQTFGLLTVTKFVRSEVYRYGKTAKKSRRNYFYECVCACGAAKIANRINLLTAHTKTCGCATKPKGSKSPRWTGHGEISGAYWKRIRNHARIRELEFDITINDAWVLFVHQKKRCALTGMRITMHDKKRTASLDRIRNNRGYVIGNVQWVHKEINRMKWTLTMKRFTTFCQAVVNHTQRQKSCITQRKNYKKY